MTLSKDEKIPRAISSSILKIGDLELKVYVLEDGSRVIDAEDLEIFFKYLVEESE
jgi:hypothetical protein